MARCFLRRGLPKARALWFCAFAQYQPGDEAEDPGPTVAQQLALDPFGSVIRSLEGNCMLVVQTSQGDVYSRGLEALRRFRATVVLYRDYNIL